MLRVSFSGLWCERSAGPDGRSKKHLHRDAILDGSRGHRVWRKPWCYLRLQGEHAKLHLVADVSGIHGAEWVWNQSNRSIIHVIEKIIVLIINMTNEKTALSFPSRVTQRSTQTLTNRISLCFRVICGPVESQPLKWLRELLVSTIPDFNDIMSRNWYFYSKQIYWCISVSNLHDQKRTLFTLLTVASL